MSKQRFSFVPMDITSLYFFSELAKDLHMTRTAERLYISQQTLSNHILRLEKQLGCQLFYRKPSLALTYAGEQVLVFALQVLREQINLQDILADVEDQKRGRIRFGASTLRMNTCLPYILPVFSAEYPHVEVEISNHNSRTLEPMLMSGDLDYALIAGLEIPDSEKGANLCRELVLTDPIYMCVTDDILRKYLGDKADAAIEASHYSADLHFFSDVPFLLFENKMGRLILHCFEEAGITPHTYIRSPYTHIITQIGLQGTAAFFSTSAILAAAKDEIPDNMHVFPMLHDGKPLCQEIFLAWNQDRYIPAYASRFLDLLRECFKDVGQYIL